MKNKVFIIVVILGVFFLSSLHADECMEGDCENGYGVGFTEDNLIYEGQWKDGLPHGSGELSVSKGKVIKGVWERGELVSEESVTKNGEKEEGQEKLFQE